MPSNPILNGKEIAAMVIGILTLKQGLILFWTLWITLVFLHNVADALKELGVLPESWRFASMNFNGIREISGEDHPLPRWVAGILFAGVIAWQGMIAYLFWETLMNSIAMRGLDQDGVITAFGANLALWVAFMLSDEGFGQYELLAAHLRIFTSQIITLLFLLLVPG
jgi:hypothetical protein